MKWFLDLKSWIIVTLSECQQAQQNPIGILKMVRSRASRFYVIFVSLLVFCQYMLYSPYAELICHMYTLTYLTLGTVCGFVLNNPTSRKEANWMTYWTLYCLCSLLEATVLMVDHGRNMASYWLLKTLIFVYLWSRTVTTVIVEDSPHSKKLLLHCSTQTTQEGPEFDKTDYEKHQFITNGSSMNEPVEDSAYEQSSDNDSHDSLIDFPKTIINDSDKVNESKPSFECQCLLVSDSLPEQEKAEFNLSSSPPSTQSTVAQLVLNCEKLTNSVPRKAVSKITSAGKPEAVKEPEKSHKELETPKQRASNAKQILCSPAFIDKDFPIIASYK